MRVAFDYQIFYSQKYGGISRYFIELADELYRIKGCEPKIIAPYHGNEYLHQIRNKPYAQTFGPMKKRIYYNRFYNKQQYINDKLLQNFCTGNDVILHETYYSLPTNVSCPKVITIHDMIYELFHNGLADEYEVIEMKKRAIMEADLIISVSENTKKDLIQFYPEVAQKTFVVHHGVKIPDLPKQSSPHPKPFLLFVGSRTWYKNFLSLLNVYGSEKKINSSFDLICFGEKGVSEDDRLSIEKHKIGNKVHFVTGNDNYLNSLYGSATGLVYLSSYEGFGMPVLEAMANKCPVLCSNASSLPEVAGDAALMINAKNEEEIRAGLMSLCFDNEVRQKFIDRGLARIQQFTWKKCAEETFEVYKKLRP